MKTRHYAYLAGMIDGDGCIAASKTFQKRSNCFQYDLKIEVTSSLRSTAKRLIQLFGGTHHANVVDGVVYWKWVCQVREKQRDVLEGIIPHLVIKRAQADFALAFVELGHANVPEARAVFVRAIQKLNQHLRTDSLDLPKTDDKSFFAYLAGLIDAEGTLSIVAKNESTVPYIAVYNDSERLMRWLEEATGKPFKPHKPPNHLIWRFVGNSKEREKLLLAILPYLLTKKEQAVLLLEYVRMFKQKDPARRVVLKNRVYDLNHIRASETNTPDCSSPEQMTEPELAGDRESELTVM